MASAGANNVDNLRSNLAAKLGFEDEAVAAPFLNYIVNHHIGQRSLEAHLNLFTLVVEYFNANSPYPPITSGSATTSASRSDTIQRLIDHLVTSNLGECFGNTAPGTPSRKEHVEDTLLYNLGVWTTMLSHFQKRRGIRTVLTRYSKPFEQNLASLVQGSDLLPTSNPSTSTKACCSTTLADFTATLAHMLSMSSGSPGQHSLTGMSQMSITQGTPSQGCNSESTPSGTLGLNALSMI